MPISPRTVDLGFGVFVSAVGYERLGAFVSGFMVRVSTSGGVRVGGWGLGSSIGGVRVDGWGLGSSVVGMGVDGWGLGSSIVGMRVHGGCMSSPIFRMRVNRSWMLGVPCYHAQSVPQRDNEVCVVEVKPLPVSTAET